MDMDTLVRQALDAAKRITGRDENDEETRVVAFKLACAAMAMEEAQ